ncbi:MAG: DUF4398 domain-containing protein [bacterium]
MNARSYLKTFCAMLLLAFLAGCAEAPKQAVDATNAALEAAKAAEADRYAADLFNAAKDSLAAAMTEVENQNAKFALTRNYGRAQQLLDSALTGLNNAKDAAAANKEKVKVEADTLAKALAAGIENAKKLMTKAPRGKEGKAALEMIQNDISAVEASVAEISTAAASGDYLSARDKAQAGLAKINSIVEELNQAIAKKSR